MANESAWMLRYYRDGDEQGILDCLTTAFGRWPAVDIDVAPIEHLRWKLDSDPLAREFHYVAESDGRIIGTQLVVVQRLKVGESELLMDSLTDYAVHPDWQGRGVARALWDFEAERFRSTFDVVSSISDSHIVRHQIDTSGWRRPLANAPQWVECPARMVTQLSADIRLATIASFGPSFDAFYREALAQFDLCVARDARYLNWRYTDRRAGNYTIRTAMDSGDLVGYAVLTRSRGKGVIADLFALPDRMDAVEALLRDALCTFAAIGLPTVRTWMPKRHPYRQATVVLGFQPLRPLGYFRFGPHRNVAIPPLADPCAVIHFVPGDTDIV